MSEAVTLDRHKCWSSNQMGEISLGGQVMDSHGNQQDHGNTECSVATAEQAGWGAAPTATPVLCAPAPLSPSILSQKPLSQEVAAFQGKRYRKYIHGEVSEPERVHPSTTSLTWGRHGRRGPGKDGLPSLLCIPADVSPH